MKYPGANPKSIQQNVDVLERMIPAYREASGLTTRESLGKHGRELAFYLYLQFRTVMPPESSVVADAKNAKWRLRVGDVAKRLANSYMGGLGMGFGDWNKNGELKSYGSLRMLRIGKKGTPIFGRPKSRDGRVATLAEGKRFSSLTVTGRSRGGKRKIFGSMWSEEGRYGVGAKTNIEFKPSPQTAGMRAMSKREVSMFIETMLRVKGRRSLAVAWLYPNKGKAVEKMVNTLQAPLQNKNEKAELKSRGSADYIEKRHKDGDTATFGVSGNDPGHEKYPGVVFNAITKARRNMMDYLERKLPENVLKEIQQTFNEAGQVKITSYK